MAIYSNRSRRARRRSSAMMSEINVTPLVDIMLVLLIVFMVSAPLLTVGVSIDLPTTNADNLPQEIKPIIVSIQEDSVYIGNVVVDVEVLSSRLISTAKNDLTTRVYVRGDKQVNYGRIMSIMGIIKSAGFSKVALIALPDIK